MAARPEIKSGDWISIGSTDCVVSKVYPAGAGFGDCEAVFNAAKPTNDDARWTSDQWAFVHEGASGGYADKYPRLRDFVAALRRGRWWRP
jgi:hypothetical protein